jgi:hypothetical protein
MFNAPDDAGGKRARCPTCGGAIQIPKRAAERVEVFDALPETFGAGDDPVSSDAPAIGASEDRKQCPMCGEMIAAKAIKCRFCGELLDLSMRGMIQGAADLHDPAWRKVRSGLMTIYYSLVAMVGAFILLIFAIIIMGAANAGQPGDDLTVGMVIVIVVFGMVALGAGIGSLVGHFTCINVPQRSGARGLAIGAAACMAGSLLFSMIGYVGLILFILFIRRAATFLNNHRLANSAARFLVFSLAMCVGMVLLVVAAIVLESEAFLIAIGLAIFVSFIVTFVWYAALAKSMATTIDSGMK